MQQRIITVIIPLILVAALSTCKPEPANAQSERFPDLFRIECVGKIEGCACYTGATGNARNNVAYHAEAARSTGAAENGRVPIELETRGVSCWYPETELRPMPYAKVPESPLKKIDHTPKSLDKIVPGATVESLSQKPHRSLGRFWATYYHLADEHYHPGKEVAVKTPAGLELGRASEDFLKQVTWQGSGIAKNGLRLHYSGSNMRFNTYAKDMWGHGAGYGYRVFPYRTIAVNFRGVCAKIFPNKKRCGKKQVIGSLVRIREVAAKNIAMPGGTIHDGYFCATDTGSPHYIKSDRIDIFVGVHGGGNPYLPPERRSNALIAGGIRNLVPSDWRLWKNKNDRVWCDANKLPTDPARPKPGDCTYDYHVVAQQKALHIDVVLDGKGNPIRCAKRP